MSNGRTVVDIRGQMFHINGRPTYEGRRWRDLEIEGLLMNSRMVQATFDDLNAETRPMWDRPGAPFDAEANTDAFVARMDEYRRCGLLGLTVNLQGGSPQGYSKDQPWINSAFEPDGSLRSDYMARMTRVLDKADELGMVVILGLFYFGQDQVLADEQAVIRGCENVVDWLVAGNRRNVLIEVGNEVNHPKYDHAIIGAERCDELIRLIQRRSDGKLATAAGRLLVSTSLTGGKVPPGNLAAASDFILLHGNGVHESAEITGMVEACRAMAEYADQPIVFNEDDHFDFDKPVNNMLAAVAARAGWGYFDYRMTGEGFDEGYQSVPVNWAISSERKKGFFGLLREMTQGA